MRLFATAAEPTDIPDRDPQGLPWYGAAPYATGYKWPQSQLARFPNRFSIIQTPDPMRYVDRARCIDVETEAVADSYVASFLKERQDNYGDATMYCSESTFDGLWTRNIIVGLTFRLFAALWDYNPSARPNWHGIDAWAKQYDPFAGYESCILYARDFDSNT